MALKLLEKVLNGTSAEPLSATTIPCSFILIQAQRGNAASIAVGDDTVTADTGIELVKPTTDEPLDRISIEIEGGNGVDLMQIYVIGSAADGVNVLYEVF